jgi:hypothetical protein
VKDSGVLLVAVMLEDGVPAIRYVIGLSLRGI